MGLEPSHGPWCCWESQPGTRHLFAGNAHVARASRTSSRVSEPTASDGQSAAVAILLTLNSAELWLAGCGRSLIGMP